MKKLTINIPDSVELDEKSARMMLAVQLYEQGRLSLGQAAEMAGYTKRKFMELLGDYGVSVFNYDAGDLENDMMNADIEK